MIRLPLLLFVLCLAARPARAQELTGTVRSVERGDRLVLVPDTLAAGREPVEVRLYGVRAPAPGEPFGEDARRLIAGLALDRPVRVSVRSAGAPGEVLAVVTLEDGRELNEELLLAGLGWWRQEQARSSLSLPMAELQARSARRGLWSAPGWRPPEE